MTRRAELVVTNPSGLHARPAAKFVETAKRFESTLSVEKDGRRGNGKSLVSLLKLGISKDSRIVLEAEGSDADAAVEELTRLLERLEEAE
jgi:phosphotransferase system HPr (HPr) family protein